jgi:hypothetical protein
LRQTLTDVREHRLMSRATPLLQANTANTPPDEAGKTTLPHQTLLAHAAITSLTIVRMHSGPWATTDLGDQASHPHPTPLLTVQWDSLAEGL